MALAAEADFLILALPGGSATRHVVNGAVLAALGPQGYLVNIARGSVVDEPALIEALRSGTIAGAGLDVFENEPDIDLAFAGLHNTVLFPHIGSATHETRDAMADLVGREPDPAFRRPAGRHAGVVNIKRAANSHSMSRGRRPAGTDWPPRPARPVVAGWWRWRSGR